MQLAQPIRLLLEYTKTPFEDRKVSCGPAPEYDRSAWTGIKNSLGLDFPNLPYYIDGTRISTRLPDGTFGHLPEHEKKM